MRVVLWKRLLGGYGRSPQPRTQFQRWETAVYPRELIQAVKLEQQAEQGLKQLRDKPALILWGTKDFGFKELHRRRFEAALPNHHTILLDASHFWQDDQGETAVKEIKTWLMGKGDIWNCCPAWGKIAYEEAGARYPQASIFTNSRLICPHFSV